MKKFFKIILVIFLIICILCVLIFINSRFGGYKYVSDMDCINSYANSLMEFDKLIYKYENDDTELIIYSASNGDYCTCYMNKKTKKNQVYYKYKFLTDLIAPVTYHTEWNKVNDDLYFIYVDYEDDIEEIDCCGYTPVGTRLEYTNAAGEFDIFWIYVVDRTKDPDSSSKEFYNYDKSGGLLFRWAQW